MKLTAESTVINDGKLTTNIDNAQTSADNAQTTANQAKTVADNTAQNFWFKSSGTDTGAHITEISQAEFEAEPSGGNLLARTNGIAVRDGLSEVATFTEDGVSINQGGVETAHFGNDGVWFGKYAGRRIGAIITDSSLQFSPEYGGTDFRYFRQSGESVTQTFIGDGVTRQFNIFRSTTDTFSVTINGVATTAFSRLFPTDSGYGRITFTTAPAVGDVIVIAYTTSWMQPHYSFGINTVTAPYGFAEGRDNTVEGVFAHAEGLENKASGVFAHAQNHGTIASGEAQTAMGKYNIEDNNNTYALLVGNGNATTRANAFGLDWSGNIRIPGTIYTGCGTDSSGGKAAPVIVQIPANADLNDYNDYGFYGSDSSTTTNSLSHCPFTGAGFGMMVIPKSGTSTSIQAIYNGTTIFIRQKTPGGWQGWYKFTGTAV